MSLYFIITDLRGGYYVVMKEEKTKTSYFSKLINQRLNIPTKETQLKKKTKTRSLQLFSKGAWFYHVYKQNSVGITGYRICFYRGFRVSPRGPHRLAKGTQQRGRRCGREDSPWTESRDLGPS